MESSTTPYLRLRQICLVAPALEPAVQQITNIFGVEECHRDEGVGKYGLENVLFAFGDSFLEIVAPVQDGTAAGRFLQRGQRPGGSGAYMAIFDCNDPQRRKERALALGVRVAHELDYPGFYGNQFHPADCRATMLEFDRTAGGDALDGPYWPAGPHWQAGRRPECVQGIVSVVIESADPHGIAAHWSALMDVPVTRDADGASMLRFDFGAARFVPSAPGRAERLSALNVSVMQPGAVLQAAAATGLEVIDNGFTLYGVRFQPVQA